MKKTGLILLLTLLTGITMTAQRKYMADNTDSKITWYGKKIIGSGHTGTIDLKEGWLTTDGKSVTGGEFIADMNSINDTDLKDGNMKAKLEGHLKSDDFFGVEKFPFSKLVITGSTEFSDGKAVVTGNLTIKEATHPVEFEVRQLVKGDLITYTATIIFDRSLYNVRYGSGSFFAGLGDSTINDEIRLDIVLTVK